jgi:dynein heavy chain
MNYEGFLNYIGEIPIINTTEVFGLHPNAEITYYNNAAKNIWMDLLLMKSSDSAGSGGASSDDYIV